MTEEVKLINLTPHNLNIIAVDGTTQVIPASGQVARIKTRKADSGMTLNGLAVSGEWLEGVEGLPEPQPATVLIVSRLVAEQVRGRADVFVPGDLVRNEAGQVIGARGLASLE